jgi:orotate phosphoribosyltransferase
VPIDLGNELVQLLAGRRGHFLMESGYHSELWFNLNKLFESQERLDPFVRELAQRLSRYHIEAVCGPMAGGARLAKSISAILDIPYFYTERIEDPIASGFFPIKYRLPEAQRGQIGTQTVAIVDDAVSAGSAMRGTFADLVACGARPVTLGALFVFGGAAANFAAEKGLPLEGIARMSFGMWKPADCPLCMRGIPVEKVSDTQQ